jgi:DNA polymerase (family X)
MGGKAHGGKRISREAALSLYSEIVDQMPTVVSIILCGSARRLKPTCGDLDIVVVPAQDPNLAGELDKFFIQMFGHQKSGKSAKNGLFRGVQTEFYIASPNNYGTFKQMWTGSAFHNFSLRKKASEMGYSLSQYGLKCKNTGEIVEFKSEEDLYKALDTPFKKPEDR